MIKLVTPALQTATTAQNPNNLTNIFENEQIIFLFWKINSHAQKLIILFKCVPK